MKTDALATEIAMARMGGEISEAEAFSRMANHARTLEEAVNLAVATEGEVEKQAILREAQAA